MGVSETVKRSPWLICCCVCTIVVQIVIICILIGMLFVAWYLGALEQWGGNVRVKDMNQEAICWGKTIMDEKMTKAKEDCDIKDKEWEYVMKPEWDDDTDKDWIEMKKDSWDDGKCLLTKMGWIKDDWDPQYDTIEEDMDKLEVSEALSGAFDDCKGNADGDKGKFLRCAFYKIDMACRRKTNYLLWITQQASAVGEQWNKGWGSEDDGGAGVVPDHLDKVPPKPALIRFATGTLGYPGARVRTDEVSDPPMVYWDAHQSSYYTLMVVDVGLSNNGRFFHYMVNNIPGNDVTKGDVAFDWIPPFAFLWSEADGYQTDNFDFFHPFLYLVYKQEGKIEVTETQKECKDDIATARVGSSHTALAAKYKLGDPVAGNVIKVPYSGSTTDAMLCYFTKCTGTFFPAEIDKVNNLDFCSAA